MPASPTSWLAERHNSLFSELENVHAFLNGLIQWSNGFIFWFLCRQCSYRRTPTKCQKIATHTLRLYVSCYGYISKGILTLLLFLFIRFTFPYTVFYKPFLHVCIDFTRFYFSLACDISRKSVEIDSPWTVSWDSDQGLNLEPGLNVVVCGEITAQEHKDQKRDVFGRWFLLGRLLSCWYFIGKPQISRCVLYMLKIP